MNIAVVGLPLRETLALEMLVRQLRPGWQCRAAPAGRKVPLPDADVYVLDLAGRGLGRWSEAGQAELRQSLNGAPAVLVAPAFDQTWAALEAVQTASQCLVVLNKPYGVQAMRSALEKAAAGQAAQAQPIAPQAAVRTSLAPAPSVQATPPQPVLPDAPVREMTVDAFQARLAAAPASEPQLFLRKLAQGLALGQPFEIRVSFLNRLIVNPGAQWVASNTPDSALQGLCHSDALAAVADMDVLDRDDAKARACRLDLALMPLNAFLGALVQGRT